MSAKNNPQFHFKGPPDRLEAKAPFALPGSHWPPPEVEISNHRHVLQSQTGDDESGPSLSFKLPAHTPPGTTKAMVHVGNESYPATIEVQELTKIITEPQTVILAGVPGSKTAATVQVMNAGNVSKGIEPAQTIVLRRADAVSRGVRKAFKETSGDLVSRLIVLGEHLSSEPSAQATVDFKSDFSALPAGDQRNVEISVHIPDGLERSVKWSGNLSLLGMAVTVTLDVLDREGENR